MGDPPQGDGDVFAELLRLQNETTSLLHGVRDSLQPRRRRPAAEGSGGLRTQEGGESELIEGLRRELREERQLRLQAEQRAEVARLEIEALRKGVTNSPGESLHSIAELESVLGTRANLSLGSDSDGLLTWERQVRHQAEVARQEAEQRAEAASREVQALKNGAALLFGAQRAEPRQEIVEFTDAMIMKGIETARQQDATVESGTGGADGGEPQSGGDGPKGSPVPPVLTAASSQQASSQQDVPRTEDVPRSDPLLSPDLYPGPGGLISGDRWDPSLLLSAAVPPPAARLGLPTCAAAAEKPPSRDSESPHRVASDRSPLSATLELFTPEPTEKVAKSEKVAKPEDGRVELKLENGYEYMGITQISGLVVGDVVPGSNAAKAGVTPGMRVVEVGGRPVASDQEMVLAWDEMMEENPRGPSVVFAQEGGRIEMTLHSGYDYMGITAIEDLLVCGVVPGGAAERFGVRPGMRVLEVGGHEVVSDEEMVAAWDSMLEYDSDEIRVVFSPPEVRSKAPSWKARAQPWSL
eukprot:Hpha_TRINITY_DN17474_c0_g1::TRINITY_DN17474_c0_g1_i1::g.85715::m.85715